MLCHLPYGKTKVSVDIPENCRVEVVKPDKAAAVPDETKEIERALEAPVNSRRLSEIASAGERVVIIVSDAARPTPTARLLPPLFPS